MGAVYNDRPETLSASALAFPAKVVVRYPPPFIKEEEHLKPDEVKALIQKVRR